MKWSELRKKIEKKGWYCVRHGAKHDIYEHPDKNFQVQIERHSSQEIGSGLYNKIKKQVGLE